MMSHDTIFAEQLFSLLLEKRQSLASKLTDETATSADRLNLEFLNELFALAENRTSSILNSQDPTQWSEKSGEQYPHIRQNGGVFGDNANSKAASDTPQDTSGTDKAGIRLHGGVVDY